MKIIVPGIALPVLLLIIYSCSKTSTGKDLAGWVGFYSYHEDPVPTATGINRIMEWELSVSQQRDTCWGVLEITGLRTYVKLLTTLTGDSTQVDVVYNKYLDGSEDFPKGAVLFSLKRDSSKIITSWNTLQPMLAEYPQEEGICFKFKKKKKEDDL